MGLAAVVPVARGGSEVFLALTQVTRVTCSIADVPVIVHSNVLFPDRGWVHLAHHCGGEHHHPYPAAWAEGNHNAPSSDRLYFGCLSM